MISKILTTVTIIGAFASSAMAQFGGQPAPPILPADMPYFYNPASAIELVGINTTGILGSPSSCGVNYVDDTTAYTFSLPTHMNRMFQAPFATTQITDLCNIGGTQTSIVVPNDYPGETISLTQEQAFMFQLGHHYDSDGFRIIIETAADKMYNETVLGLSPYETVADIRLSLEVIMEDAIPLEDSNGDVEPPVAEDSWDCWSIFQIYQSVYDIMEMCFGPHFTPVEMAAWDWDDAHSDTLISYPALPKEFISDFKRYEKRMMAITHNFWVQNNDSTVLAITAHQNKYEFQRLAANQLIDDLVDTYADWVAAQP